MLTKSTIEELFLLQKDLKKSERNKYVNKLA